MKGYLDKLRARGFDRSRYLGAKLYRPQCSQCAALVINGVPAHERGCPNMTHECKGCNARVAARQIYCEDCA
jgi:arginyl-tRNA--protein-N-Asp/Glu arginylyltransferase